MLTWSPVRLCLLVAVFGLCTPLAAVADDTAAVNRLVVEIARRAQASEAAQVGERARLLHEALQLIDEVVAKYSSTDAAVRFATGQPVGNIDASTLRERLQNAVAVDCVDRPEPGCEVPLAAHVAAWRRELEAERQSATAARSTARQLTRQVEELRAELDRARAALDASRARSREQQVQIVDLGSRLNQALASKVEELSRYRSEFFGRMRALLADRPDVEIVGDRFVFPAEVLFAVGSPDLNDAGKARMADLAKTLKEIAATIPPDLPWILRVDGHTDRTRVRSPVFRNNWDLSAARAINVVQFLIEQGIPPYRLTATGFGEFQPIDPANTEAAYARNRRIEMKLSER